jgi:hypothetical protein
MSTLDIATKSDIQELRDMLADLLRGAGTKPATAGDDYLDIAEVAKLTRTSTKTVTKWLKEGKRDSKGRLIKLYALEFSPGFPRIPRSALVAFGQAQAFDVSTLQSAQLPPMRIAS